MYKPSIPVWVYYLQCTEQFYTECSAVQYYIHVNYAGKVFYVGYRHFYDLSWWLSHDNTLGFYPSSDCLVHVVESPRTSPRFTCNAWKWKRPSNQLRLALFSLVPRAFSQQFFFFFFPKKKKNKDLNTSKAAQLTLPFIVIQWRMGQWRL